MRAPRTPGKAEDIIALIDERDGLRRRAKPRRVRPDPRSEAHRRSRPRQRRAADRGRDRNRLAGPDRIARRAWARTSWRPKASRSATASISADLMSACSRRARNSCARCRDVLCGETRRCGRQARLCADAFHARAAYPPREGDEQYLHEFRAVLSCLHDSSVASGRGRLLAAGARQSRARVRRWPIGSPKVKGVSLVTPAFFNEFTLKLPKPGCRSSSTSWRRRASSPACPRRACMPHDQQARDLLIVAATETVHRRRLRRLRQGARGGAVHDMNNQGRPSAAGAATKNETADDLRRSRARSRRGADLRTRPRRA